MTDNQTNSQITDAVTQANVKVIGEAPAMAMSAIYQSLAHATGILFENAIAVQQQQNTLALAASNQGVMQIYSVDAAATGAPVAKDAPGALHARMMHAGESLKAAFAPASGVNPQIEAAVKLINETMLGRSGDVAYGARACADAFAAALEQIGEATQSNLMRILQAAAITACLEAMLREPSKAGEYEAVLQAAKRMV